MNIYYKISIPYYWYDHGYYGKNPIELNRDTLEQAQEIKELVIKAKKEYENPNIYYIHGTFENTNKFNELIDCEKAGYPNGYPKIYKIIEEEMNI